MARYKLGMDNFFLNVCFIEIGMYAKNEDTFMGSIRVTIKKAYVTFNGEKKSSFNFFKVSCLCS